MMSCADGSGDCLSSAFQILVDCYSEMSGAMAPEYDVLREKVDRPSN